MIQQNRKLLEEYKESTKNAIMCGKQSELITKDRYINWLEDELTISRSKSSDVKALEDFNSNLELENIKGRSLVSDLKQLNAEMLEVLRWTAESLCVNDELKEKLAPRIIQVMLKAEGMNNGK